MATGKKFVKAWVVLALFAASAYPSPAQPPNEFFGGSVPQSPPGVDAASQQLGTGGADYTTDEKAMQKKYKRQVAHAKTLIAKGDRMIRDGEARKNDRMLKKGKILKDIGEKELAKLQADNPLAELESTKKGKKDASAGL